MAQGERSSYASALLAFVAVTLAAAALLAVFSNATMFSDPVAVPTTPDSRSEDVEAELFHIPSHDARSLEVLGAGKHIPERCVSSSTCGSGHGLWFYSRTGNPQHPGVNTVAMACFTAKLPPGPRQIIGFEPDVTRGDKGRIVHHMDLFLCTDRAPAVVTRSACTTFDFIGTDKPCKKMAYVYARRSSAEHLIATKAPRWTATAWILIVAQCSAIP